jgi:hypothetical protein
MQNAECKMQNCGFKRKVGVILYYLNFQLSTFNSQLFSVYHLVAAADFLVCRF